MTVALLGVFSKTERIIYFEMLNVKKLRSGPARFTKAMEAFRVRKAIVSSFVSTNRELYTLEKFCMKGTSIHVKNI